MVELKIDKDYEIPYESISQRISTKILVNKTADGYVKIKCSRIEFSILGAAEEGELPKSKVGTYKFYLIDDPSKAEFWLTEEQERKLREPKL